MRSSGPETFDEAVARLSEAVMDVVNLVVETLADGIARGLRTVAKLTRKVARELDPKWQRRRRRALARSRRNNLYLKSIGRCR